MNKKYYLDTDNDGHWYIIPVDCKKEFEDWRGLDPDDEKSWDVPKFAHSIGGNPNSVHFENPINKL